MLEEKNISALAITSKEEVLVAPTQLEEKEAKGQTVEFLSDILEDHLFCAFFSHYAKFNTPPEEIPEKQKGKFVECSQVSLDKNKDAIHQSFDSFPLMHSKKSDETKLTSRESTKVIRRLSRRKSRSSKYMRQSKKFEIVSSQSLQTRDEAEIINQVLSLTTPKDNSYEMNFDFIYQVTGENCLLMKHLKKGLTFDFLNGNSYEGSISFNNQDGRGTYKWADGSKYKGKFVGDFPHGDGCMEWADESRYEGHFFEGLRDGSGSYSVRSSSINQTYSGYWSKGLQMGRGTLKINEKNWYEGEFENGLYSGRGMRQYPSGGKYLGGWKHGKQNGEGIMLYSNNDMYIGNWVDGKMEGAGKYVWDTFLNTQFVYPMHNTYIGQWENSARNGTGSLILSSGAVISTIWINNVKHGWGKFLCTNGTTIESDPLFVNDILVSLKDAFYEYDDTPKLRGKGSEKGSTNTWHVKDIDCIFEPHHSCISPINIPPYFMNIDIHLNKFFQMSDWNRKIRAIDWCIWSLDMPHLCDIDKVTSDFEKVYEVGAHQPVNKLDGKFEMQSDKDKNETTHAVQHASSGTTKYNPSKTLEGKAKGIKCIKFITPKRKKSMLSRMSIGRMSKSNLMDNKSNSLLRFGLEKDYSFFSDQPNDREIQSVYIFEKKWLRNTIIRHMPTLQKLYHRYSTICCKEKPHFETGLLRVLLWKLLKDVNFGESGFSIVEIDKMAVSEADPFDFVPVCEMIHYLLILSWELYTKQNKLNKNIPGINGAGFDLFVTEKIYPLINKEELYEPLFPNSEVMPIEALYRLFVSLGPKLTLKKLVQRLTRKVERHYDKHVISFLPEPNLFFKHCLKGQNGILPGGEIIYKASKLPDFDYIKEEFRSPPDVIKSVDLDFLGGLGIDTVIDTVVKCFPHVTNSRGEIINNNYEICFLEFLDVLTQCLNAYLLKMMKYSGDKFDENNLETINNCLDQMIKETKVDHSDMGKSRKSDL